MKNGITDVRDFATGSLGIPDGRMVLRSSSRNIYEHISFLSLDSSPVFAVFAISGKMFYGCFFPNDRKLKPNER